MKLGVDLGLNLPVLYVNPPCNAHPGLIEEVSRAGGVGIVDHVTSGPAEFQVSQGVRHGVRIPLRAMFDWSWDPSVVLALLPLEDSAGIAELGPDALAQVSVP
ncbi:MAG: hypothetical protein FJY85_01815, partial [Deltaproteobacteria bacterium]|nr:hypothetical protein [Deltaproteobacteria bacterium]